MANAREIKSKIASVKNTQKITNAMQMVAASKMKKAQLIMATSRPYATNIKRVIGHIASATAKDPHPYIIDRDLKRAGVIVVSTDRGLCGGLNINLFKEVATKFIDYEKNNIAIDWVTLGVKAINHFNRFGGNIVAQKSGISDKPEVKALIGIIKVLLDKFNQGKVDRIYLAYNQFKNTMMQTPKIEQILPLPKFDKDIKSSHKWDYIYEPDPFSLLKSLIKRYLEAQVYQAVVENLSSEQAARMVAMKAATDNAADLIGDLELAYNKARQASITQELTEIIAGAAAV